jgi:hypothetical protein
MLRGREAQGGVADMDDELWDVFFDQRCAQLYGRQEVSREHSMALQAQTEELRQRFVACEEYSLAQLDEVVQPQQSTKAPAAME